MERKLRWTNRAIQKLDSIADFIAKDNPVRAKIFVKELKKKIEILQHQQLGTPWQIFGTKQFVIHTHYIAIYRVKGDEVQVLTILHSAQERR